MTDQFCGILDLGSGQDHLGAVETMAESLASPYGGKACVQAQQPLWMAQISKQPQPGILQSADALLAGNLDLLYLVGAPIGQAITEDELLLRLSEAPDKAVRDIDGEYAFAFWHKPSGRFCLIRDRAGTRPIYYSHKPGSWLAFASQPQALRAAGLAAQDIDVPNLVRMTVGNFGWGAQTLFKDTFRVQAAECLTVHEGQVSHDQYWSLDGLKPISASTPYTEVVADMRAILTRAIVRRLDPQKPAFSHLSGGLDSSSIAAIAAQELAKSGQTLTGYAFHPADGVELEQMVDERPALEAICAAHRNIRLHPVKGGFFDGLADGRVAEDFPVLRHTSDLHDQLLSHAAAEGAECLFSGVGGDQGISHGANHGFAEMFMAGRWRSMWSLARMLGTRQQRQAWRIIARDLYETVLPGPLKKLVSALIPRLKPEPRPFLSYLTPGAAREAAEGLQGAVASTVASRLHQLTSGHLSYVCEELSWRASQHGLSYTHPFLDREVLEYVIRLPAEVFLQGGRRRSLLRDVAAGALPQPVREREEKLIHDPGEIVRVAGNLQDLLATVDRLRGTQAARIFALDAIAETLRDLHTPEELTAQTQLLAQLGVQYSWSGTPALVALTYARFAAQELSPRET